MGSTPLDPWPSSYGSFNGQDLTSYPVELFIALVEGEFEDKLKLTKHSKDLMDLQSPEIVDVLKSFEWTNLREYSWQDLKECLLAKFGRTGKNSVPDLVVLVKSVLGRYHSEPLSVFWLRLHWVLKTVGFDQLPKILFLACLEDSEYASLPELESKRDNDVHGYLKTLQNPPPVVKSEYPPHGDSEYLLRSKIENSFEVENAKEDIPINFQEEVPTATLEIKFEATEFDDPNGDLEDVLKEDEDKKAFDVNQKKEEDESDGDYVPPNEDSEENQESEDDEEDAPLSRVHAKKLKTELDVKHRCDRCDLDFRFKSGLERHNRIEHPDNQPGVVSSKKSKELRSGLGIFSTQQRGVDGKYRCQHCLQPFRFRSRMLKHIRDEHGKRYVCEECDAGFQFKAHLAQHIKDDHPELEARHPCPECQMTFKNKNRLEVHQKTEHFGEKGHCGVCNVTVNDAHAWNAHESEHHLGKCDVCGCDGFNDLKLMRTHHSVAHRGYQTRCPDCLNMIRYREYGRHKCKTKTKSDERYGAVRQANRLKSTNLRVYKLKEGEDPVNVKSLSFVGNIVREGVCTWVCLHCAEEFPKRNPCYAHIKKEHNGIFFRCDKCNYVAVKFEKLVEHKIRIHGEMECFESLKCDQCPFKTHKHSRLEYHKKDAHSEESKEERTCQVCGKELFNKWACQTHVQTVHMKQQNVKCPMFPKCDMAFYSYSAKNKHVAKEHPELVKEPEKLEPKVCTICGLKLTNEKALKEHVKHFHEGKPVECKMCGKVLKNERSLTNHTRKIHQIRKDGTESKPKKCPYPGCNFTHYDGYKLQAHYKKAHENIKPFECKACGSSYVQLKDVCVHIATKHENWSKEYANANFRKIVDEKHPALVRNKILDKTSDLNSLSPVKRLLTQIKDSPKNRAF